MHSSTALIMLTLHKQVLGDRQAHSVNTKKKKLTEKLPPLAAAGLSCPGTAGWSGQPDRAKFWWSVWPWLRQDLASLRNALLTSKERTVRSSGNTWNNHFCGMFIYEKREFMGNDSQLLCPAWTVATAHCQLWEYNPHEDSSSRWQHMPLEQHAASSKDDRGHNELSWTAWCCRALCLDCPSSSYFCTYQPAHWNTACCMCCVLSYSTYKPSYR